MTKEIVAISSCVHLGEKKCREDLFLEFLEAVREAKASLCLIGDIHDVGGYCGTKHQGSNWDNEYTPDDQMQRSVKLLKSVIPNLQKGRILQGNHEERLKKAMGIEMNRQVALAVGVPEVYRASYTTIKVGGKRIFMAHGGSKTDFSKVLAGHEGQDIIALGHTHQLSHEMIGRRGKAGKRNVHLIRCGTFLEEPRYGKMALYPPNPLGAAWITINGDEVSVDLGVTPRK